MNDLFDRSEIRSQSQTPWGLVKEVVRDGKPFIIAVSILGVVAGGIYADVASSPPSPVNAGFVGTEIHTHLTCQSISADRVVIDRDEPFGTLFNPGNFVLFKELTQDRKRRWTLLLPDMVCEELEQ